MTLLYLTLQIFRYPDNTVILLGHQNRIEIIIKLQGNLNKRAEQHMPLNDCNNCKFSSNKLL